jgi:hypothetical protein
MHAFGVDSPADFSLACVMQSFSEIVTRWPSLQTLANDMGGVPVTTVQSWRDRDSIPNRRWPCLIKAAKARGIRGVTYEKLARMVPGSCVQRERA